MVKIGHLIANFSSSRFPCSCSNSFLSL